jgi:hypothetical protein
MRDVHENPDLPAWPCRAALTMTIADRESHAPDA